MKATNPDTACHDRWLFEKILSRLQTADFEPNEIRALIAIMAPVHGRVIAMVEAGKPVAGVRHLKSVPTTTTETTGA